MDLVTLTDHDTIDGGLAIAHLPGTFLSEEVTCELPGGRQLHLNTFGIDEAQHTRIGRLRLDPEAFFAYLREEGIAASVNHLFSAVTGPRELADIALALQSVRLIEVRNGMMPEEINSWAEEASRAHRMGQVAGSDGHTLASVARAWTEVAGASCVADFLAGVRAGACLPAGRHGRYVRTTADVVRNFGGCYRELTPRAVAGMDHFARFAALLTATILLPLVPLVTGALQCATSFRRAVRPRVARHVRAARALPADGDRRLRRRRRLLAKPRARPAAGRGAAPAGAVAAGRPGSPSHVASSATPSQGARECVTDPVPAEGQDGLAGGLPKAAGQRGLRGQAAAHAPRTRPRLRAVPAGRSRRAGCAGPRPRRRRPRPPGRSTSPPASRSRTSRSGSGTGRRRPTRSAPPACRRAACPVNTTSGFSRWSRLRSGPSPTSTSLRAGPVPIARKARTARGTFFSGASRPTSSATRSSGAGAPAAAQRLAAAVRMERVVSTPRPTTARSRNPSAVSWSRTWRVGTNVRRAQLWNDRRYAVASVLEPAQSVVPAIARKVRVEAGRDRDAQAVRHPQGRAAEQPLRDEVHDVRRSQAPLAVERPPAGQSQLEPAVEGDRQSRHQSGPQPRPRSRHALPALARAHEVDLVPVREQRLHEPAGAHGRASDLGRVGLGDERDSQRPQGRHVRASLPGVNLLRHFGAIAAKGPALATAPAGMLRS